MFLCTKHIIYPLFFILLCKTATENETVYYCYQLAPGFITFDDAGKEMSCWGYFVVMVIGGEQINYIDRRSGLGVVSRTCDPVLALGHIVLQSYMYVHIFLREKNFKRNFLGKSI